MRVHAILITLVDPRRAEDALLRQIYVVARVKEKQTLRVRIEGRRECLCSRIESVNLGRGGGRRCSGRSVA